MQNKIVSTVQRLQFLRVVVQRGGQPNGGQNPHVQSLFHRLRVLSQHQQQHGQLRLTPLSHPNVLLAVVVVQQRFEVVGFAQRAQRQLRRDLAFLQQLPLRAGHVVLQNAGIVQIVEQGRGFGARRVENVLSKMARPVDYCRPKEKTALRRWER